VRGKGYLERPENLSFIAKILFRKKQNEILQRVPEYMTILRKWDYTESSRIHDHFKKMVIYREFQNT